MNSIVTIVNNNKNSLSSVVIILIPPFSLHCPNSGSISRLLILLQNSNSFLTSAFHMSIGQAHIHIYFSAMLKNVQSFPFTYVRNQIHQVFQNLIPSVEKKSTGKKIRQSLF